MVLHGEGRQRLVAHALYGAVVEVTVGDFEAVWHGLRQDGEVVVLARYLDLSRRKVLDRVVAAVVPELEPPRLRAAGDRKKLMPEADAHYGSDFLSTETQGLRGTEVLFSLRLCVSVPLC